MRCLHSLFPSCLSVYLCPTDQKEGKTGESATTAPFILGLEVPLFTLGIKTTATKYETRSMQTGNVTPDPEAYLFSATGIPEERMELDEMQLAYPFLCTKVNPSFIVHLGLVWGKRLYSMS